MGRPSILLPSPRNSGAVRKSAQLAGSPIWPKRTDKRPLLSGLRESGAIEQDADLLLFLDHEEYYNREDPSLAGKGELIIAKARNGPLGTIDRHYDA